MIVIKPKNHKCFTAHLPILPILSSTKRQAIVDGKVFELYDPQLKPDNPNESVVFEYEIRIFTQLPTRIMINNYESPEEVFKAYEEQVLQKLGKDEKLVGKEQRLSLPGTSRSVEIAAPKTENIIEISEHSKNLLV